MNTSTSIHQEAELWASAASTGGLTETELQAWNDHIAACPACKQLNEEELSMANLIKRTLDPDAPDPGFEQRILLKLNKARLGNGNRWYQYLLFHPVLATAAAACLVVVAIAGTGRLIHGGKATSVSAAASPSLDGLPPAVRSAIQSQSDGKTVSNIERNEDHGEIFYTVATKTPDGREMDFRVAGDGSLLSIDTTLAEVPREVRNAIEIEATQGGLEEIGKTFDKDGTNYVATITSHDGSERDFTFAKDGTILDVETGLTELSAPLQAAIKAQVGEGRLKGIDKTFDNGETDYVATIALQDGRERDFTFGEDGTLLEVETALTELPAPVQAAIKAQAGGGRLEGVVKTFDGDEANYVATITSQDGRERDFTFNGEGSLSSMEVTQDELPAAVQEGIRAQVGEGRLNGIDKTFDDGQISYDASMTMPDGRRRDFSVSGQGKLLSREVAMNEAPKAVQQVISQTLGKGKVVEINQSFADPDNSVPYEIEARKDGKPLYFVVSPTGDLLSMEN